MKPLTAEQRNVVAANTHLMSAAHHLYHHRFEAMRRLQPWFHPDDVLVMSLLAAVVELPDGAELTPYYFTRVRWKLGHLSRTLAAAAKAAVEYVRRRHSFGIRDPKDRIDAADEVRFLGLAGEGGRILLETQTEAMARTGYSDAHVQRLRLRARTRALLQHRRRK